MATEPKTRKPRKTIAEKLVNCQSASRMGLEELSLLVATKLNLDPKDARVYLDAYLETIVETLKTGRPVVLPGFGSFKGHHRDARKVRNPRVKSGPDAFVDSPAKTVFKFKAGTDLKPLIG